MEDLRLGLYQHFKGMEVEVIGIATHSETMEKMVVYRHSDPIKGLGANTLWVRPLTMFMETINKDGKDLPRFKFLK